MKRIFALVAVIALALIGYGLWVNWGMVASLFRLAEPAPALPSGEPLPFSVPEGFTARLYSGEVPGARVMIRDPRGALLVSETSDGSVVALPDENGDSEADGVYEVIKGLNNPHGLAFSCDDRGDNCVLYIAEEDAVRSYAYDVATRKAVLKDTLMALPADGGHSTRTVLLHPDGTKLLVSIGSSCNVCEEKDARRAAVYSIDIKSKKSTRFAWGLRNTVFMAIHPVTGEIWGTDNGRDLIGDDLPPDEINIIKENGWYGWPWFYGKSVEDHTFSPNVRPSFAQEAIPSHIDIPAHSAALGIAFVPEEGWPEEYWHDALVAYHGSWNRSVPTGYKIVRIDLEPDGTPTGRIEDFMTGFTEGGRITGRPVGLLAEPGGILYVSDDRAGAIYRITRDTI